MRFSGAGFMPRLACEIVVWPELQKRRIQLEAAMQVGVQAGS